MNRTLTPIVLAAGASSRMGRPKALLDFDGRTALDRILDTCALAGLGPPLVVLGADREAIAAGADLSRATVVDNPRWKEGMTASLQAGVAALPKYAEGFFVWPVDLPLVPARVPREQAIRFAVLRQLQKTPIVVPFHGRRGHPVLFDARYAPEIKTLAPGDAPRSVVERHAGQVEEIEGPAEVVEDLDTPGDYEKARR